MVKRGRKPKKEEVKSSLDEKGREDLAMKVWKESATKTETKSETSKKEEPKEIKKTEVIQKEKIVPNIITKGIALRKLKRLRVLGPFTHPKTGVRIGWGEPVPEDINEQELHELMVQNRIVEVNEYGERQLYKKLIDLKESDIRNLLQKTNPDIRVINYIKRTELSQETLHQMHAYASSLGRTDQLKNFIWDKILGSDPNSR